MHDRDVDRQLEAEYARLVDRTDRIVETPDVDTIHRRAVLRTVRGIGATFAATTGVGLLLGATVLGVGGVGMGPDVERSAGHRAATPSGRPAATATTVPVPVTAPLGTATGSAGPRTPAAAPSPTLASTPPPSPSSTGPAPSSAPPASPSAVPPPSPSSTRSPRPRSTRPPAPPRATRPPVPTKQASPRTPPPSPSSDMSAMTVRRPPLALMVAYTSAPLDDQGCRRSRRVPRTVAEPTPQSVVQVVLTGPTTAEHGRGVRAVYGRNGRPTPAEVSTDWSRRQVSVDFPSASAIALAGPAACRGREIRWPVLDALRQSHPEWTVRFTLGGRADRFSDYVGGR